EAVQTKDAFTRNDIRSAAEFLSTELEYHDMAATALENLAGQDSQRGDTLEAGLSYLDAAKFRLTNNETGQAYANFQEALKVGGGQRRVAEKAAAMAANEWNNRARAATIYLEAAQQQSSPSDRGHLLSAAAVFLSLIREANRAQAAWMSSVRAF